MNAPVTKNQFGYTLGNLSYIGHDYEDDVGSTKPQDHGLVATLRGMFARMTEWQHKRQVMEELSMMTDRDLSDIGLTRADLPRVFEAEFTTSHARNRSDYVAY